MYSCTCLDATVCKHVHLVHMQSDGDTDFEPPPNTYMDIDLQYFADVIAPNDVKTTLQNTKEKVLSSISELQLIM